MAYRVKFRLRAHEVSRVEAFSDVVFGFALTLIVVSLEVPRTYAALVHEMRGFIGFAICFAILAWVWFEHHTWFRRYAMQDGFTIFLNNLLLFLILFYIYPMKFMFELVTRRIPNVGDPSSLFTIYGLGFAGIFVVLALMYVHAYRRRETLELNAAEVYDTMTKIWFFGAYVAIALVSVILAHTLSRAAIGWAGLVYFLLGPVSAVIGFMRGNRRGPSEDLVLSQSLQS